MKVVLSHPYSGALYWWLAAQHGNAGEQGRKRPHHSYYRTLYGDVDRNLDIALACCVVFEEVVLPGADTPYSQFDSRGEDEMHLAALDLFSGWEPIREAQQLLAPHEEELLRDPVIAGVLGRLPRDAQHMALLYAMADVVLTQAHAAPVLCAPGRRRIVLRLIELGVADIPAEVTEAIHNSQPMMEGLEGYVAIAGLTFISDSIDRLARVKWNQKIRDYAGSFQAVLLNDAEQGFEPLLDKIADAWSSAEVATEVGGVFSAASRSLGPVGLVPGAGTVTGLVSMGADGASVLAERQAEKLRWYELGPEIRRFESLENMQAELHKRGLR
jgi:hypothetical protein